MEFRLATIADTADIANLIHHTWGTPAQENLISNVLTRPDKPVWIVRNDAGLAGFCSGFMTHAADGTPRWEVDLLAVATEARGHGLGRSLVAHSVQSGRQQGAALCRGLIAVDNAASARCFEVNGFRATSTCDLWVSAPAAVEILPPHHPDSVHLIPVETLTYRGIWVEGRYDATAFAAAQQMALADRRVTIGAVIPDGTAHDAARLKFTHVDTYRWWILSM
jgi:GNAT superfamily N-acetyltransferase